MGDTFPWIVGGICVACFLPLVKYLAAGGSQALAAWGGKGCACTNDVNIAFAIKTTLAKVQLYRLQPVRCQLVKVLDLKGGPPTEALGGDMKRINHKLCGGFIPAQRIFIGVFCTGILPP